MKTKIFIYSGILSLLILVACQKEDESKNPYKKPDISSYFFTEDERDLIMFDETSQFTMVKNGYDTTLVAIASIIHDTLTNNQGNKYESVVIKFKTKKRMYPNIGFIEQGFFKMSKANAKLDIQMSLDNLYPTNNIVISNLAEHYNSKVINGKTYHNVYRIEKDSSRNEEHPCFIFRAFISPESGFIKLNENCGEFLKVD